MAPDALFHLSSTLAMIGWVSLLILARYDIVTRLIIPVGVCGLLGFLYLYLIINHMGGTEGGLGSLTDVASCFRTRTCSLPDGSTIWPSTCSLDAGRSATRDVTGSRSF